MTTKKGDYTCDVYQTLFESDDAMKEGDHSPADSNTDEEEVSLDNETDNVSWYGVYETSEYATKADIQQQSEQSYFIREFNTLKRAYLHAKNRLFMGQFGKRGKPVTPFNIVEEELQKDGMAELGVISFVSGMNFKLWIFAFQNG